MTRTAAATLALMGALVLHVDAQPIVKGSFEKPRFV